MTDPPVRPFTAQLYTSVSKLTAEDIGLTLQLQERRPAVTSERVEWAGPRWVVVGELIAVSHRAEATSIVLQVAGNKLRLDVDPQLEVETPPRERLRPQR